MIPLFTRKLIIRALAGRSLRWKAEPLRSFRVAIFKVDRIGDFILATGAIRALTEFFGAAHCALLVSNLVGELARREFPGVEIIEIPMDGGGLEKILPNYWATASKLGRYQFDKVISLRYQRTLVHHLVLSWMQSKEFVGIENSRLGIYDVDEKIYQNRLSIELPDPAQVSPGNCLELERHRAIVSYITGKKAAEVLPRLSHVQAVKGEYLLATPCSSCQIKDYPKQRLIETFEKIQRALGLPIRLAGGPAEQRQLHEIRQSAIEAGITNIQVQVPGSLAAFCATIAHAKAILTVDTSTAHIATALDKPTVVLLGGGHYGIFGPWHRSKKQIWLTNSMSCFHCNWQCTHPTSLCIADTSPERIFESLCDALEAEKSC